MNLIPWKGKHESERSAELSPLVTLRQEMDRLLESFFRGPLGAIEWPFGDQGAWMPAIDVRENEAEVTVRAELPGLEPQDLDVRLSGNQLTISGEKKQSQEEQGQDRYRSEIRFGAFRRTVQVPEGVDPESVEAKYAGGVLTLRMKKTRAAPARRIEIKGP